MKRVLITGAAGFIGRQCIPLLAEKGYEIHAVDINEKPETTISKNIHWHVLDMMDTDKTGRLMSDIKPGHLLHFAWYTEHGKYWLAPENFKWIQASMALLKSFHSTGGRRAVMAGTCAEYEWKDGICSEASTPLKPATLYGKCRHEFQTMVDTFAKNTGLSYASGRIFYVYGPYENPRRLIPAVISSLLRGEEIGCSHCNQRRDFLYVQDVASAFVALLESSVMGAVNIGSGTAVPLKEMVDAITKKIGHASLVRFGQKDAPKDEPPLLVADVRRLREEVKWFPCTDLDKGLDMTIQWWKDYLRKK